MGTVVSGKGRPVAILKRNTPALYCIPADVYEAMLEDLEDAEKTAIADERADGLFVQVSLDDL